MTALHPYSEYKYSGVDWIGDIPEHWDTYPHRSLFAEVIERGYPDEEMLSVTISQGVIRQAQLLANSSKKDSSNTDKSKYKLVSEGDIAYNKMRAWQGAIGVSAFRGIISPAYIIVHLRDDRNNPRYFHYLFRTPLFTTEAERWSYGITSDQWSLRYGEFKQIYSPLPLPDEQDAIVQFLDVAERCIRRYIRTKQKLIKLLNEQKQAIIQQAVTSGLNLDVPMKDSGVEWLGEIPAHWEVLRAKFLFREINNRSETGQETQLSMSQKYGLVPSHTISEWRLRSESYVGAKITEPNDLVLNRLKAHLGVFALNSQRGLVSPDYTVLRAIRPMVERYFELTLKTPACRLELKQRAKGIVEGFWRLYTDDFYEIPLPVPSIEEQDLIVKTLKHQLENIEYSINQITNEIDLIREYRTRLIADVVTGKMDVRGLAFEMPEEFDDDDLLDVDEDELLEEDELEEVIDGED